MEARSHIIHLFNRKHFLNGKTLTPFVSVRKKKSKFKHKSDHVNEFQEHSFENVPKIAEMEMHFN